jgi:hypothetical protein
VGQSVPPKPGAVRRNPRSGPLILPAEGRKGDTPEWPLDELNSSELRLWKELWATPQAVAWERYGWARVVARYCRVVIIAEGMDKDALSEARQLEDRIGLTPKAMRMLMWTVAADEVAERRHEAQESTPTARGRIKAVG